MIFNLAASGTGGSKVPWGRGRKQSSRRQGKGEPVAAGIGGAARGGLHL